MSQPPARYQEERNAAELELIMVRSRLGCGPRRALDKGFRRTRHSGTGPYCMNVPAMSSEQHERGIHAV